MDLYRKLLEEVEQGSRFDVDFKNKKLKINRKEYDVQSLDRDELGVGKLDTKEVLEVLEKLYEKYKYSIPSERSEAKRRKYFYALPVDELSIEQMCVGLAREYAQAQLEAWLLFNMVVGNFKWTDDLGKWYWHGRDKDLIVLKGWC